jgi:hypothetical protein
LARPERVGQNHQIHSDTLGQFYDDPTAKKLINQLDNHKNSFSNYLRTIGMPRGKLVKIAQSTDAVLARTDAIIADKQNQWFSSRSLTTIQTN